MKKQTYSPTESFMEGFLFKQGAKGLIRGYKKRWFVLVNGKLTYSRSPYSPEIGHVKMDDCTKVVSRTEGKEGSKKYIFAVQTTFGRDYVLQASSEAEQARWMEAINAYHGMATNATQPLMPSLSESQLAERARRRQTVMYPNRSNEEEGAEAEEKKERVEAPRARPQSMMMVGGGGGGGGEQHLGLSSVYTDVAALNLTLTSTPTTATAATDNPVVSSPHSVTSPGRKLAAQEAQQQHILNSNTKNGKNNQLYSLGIDSTAGDDLGGPIPNGTAAKSPRVGQTAHQQPAFVTSAADESSSDSDKEPSNGGPMEADEEEAVVVYEKGPDGKQKKGRQMFKRKNPKKHVLLADLGRRVNALEEQLKASEQRNEERKQAQEVLSEELAEERRRFDEEKRKWAAQVEQLKERYFQSLVVSAKLNHMLSSDGESVNIRAPALWEKAEEDEVEFDDYANYIARHIAAASSSLSSSLSSDRRRTVNAFGRGGEGGGESKVGYDSYYSYVRDDNT